MKKITLNINETHVNQDGAEKLQEALTSLSGVVFAEVFPSANKARAYAGDELDAAIVTDTAGKAGFSLSVIGEDYLADLSDVKSGLPRG